MRNGATAIGKWSDSGREKEARVIAIATEKREREKARIEREMDREIKETPQNISNLNSIFSILII